jgi:hypothetical protein
MLNQFKWDVKDFWMRCGWTFLVMPLVFFVALIPVATPYLTAIEFISTFLIRIGCGLGILYLIILPNLFIFSWLNGNQARLSFSAPVNLWKMLASKLLLAAGLNIITSIFILQIVYIFNRHLYGGIRWLTLNDLRGIPDAVFLMCLINLTFVFSNLIANGIHWARLHKSAFSWGKSILIYIAFMILAMFANYPLWIGLDCWLHSSSWNFLAVLD